MQKRIRLLFASSALLASILAGPVMAHDYSSGEVDVDHPWSRPTPPGTPMGVGYMVIRNNGDSDITLLGASTPRADRVSIHETRMEDGVMVMQPLANGLSVAAGEVVELKPRSYHLMLEQLVKPLQAGERVPLTLEFDGADTMRVELNIQSLDGEMTEPEMDHSGHQMDQ